MARLYSGPHRGHTIDQVHKGFQRKHPRPGCALKPPEFQHHLRGRGSKLLGGSRFYLYGKYISNAAHFCVRQSIEQQHTLLSLLRTRLSFRAHPSPTSQSIPGSPEMGDRTDQGRHHHHHKTRLPMFVLRLAFFTYWADAPLRTEALRQHINIVSSTCLR